jgi:hypothetical protein
MRVIRAPRPILSSTHREHAPHARRRGDHRQSADLAPPDPEAEADAWDAARLSREVREYATEFGIRPELRFNDLRGSKVTELVWSGISVPDLAIRIGWKIETAAKMLGVYAALNPGRATVLALASAAEAGRRRQLSGKRRD